MGEDQIVWQPEYKTPGTLGAALEAHFRRLTGACRIVQLDSKKANLSHVPGKLTASQKLNPTLRVKALQGVSAEKIFFSVFSTPSIPLVGADVDATKQIQAQRIRRAPLPEKGFSQADYEQSCETVLRAAIEAKLTPPMASIQAAFSGASSTRGSLVIASGTFVSPLHAALTSTQPEQRRYALAAVWQSYAAGAIDEKSPYYVKYLDGVAVYEGLASSVDTSGTLDFGASGGFAFVRADGSLQLKRSTSESLQIHDYSIYLRDQSIASTAALPTAQEIAASFLKDTPNYEATSTLLLKGQPHRHVLTIDGMPDEMCKASLWRPVNEGGASPDVSLSSVQFVSTETLGRCVLNLEFMPPDSLFVGGEATKPYSLSYELEHTNAIGDLKLKVPVNKLLNRADDLVPESLGQYSTVGQSKTVGGRQAFEWHLPDMTLKDANNRILTQRVASAKVKSTTCKYVEIEGATAEFLTKTPGSRTQLSLVLPLKQLGTGAPALQPKGSCGIDVSVMLPIQNLSTRAESLTSTSVSVSVNDFVVVEPTANAAVPVAQ